MSTIAIQAALERAQKRWIFGALALALLLHLFLAWALGWYKLAGLEMPFDHSTPTGPFTVKRIEINPDALKADQPDPIAKLPVAEPPKNPAQFNLDPHLVEKALQAPLPALSSPPVPEPNKVIAATDLNQGLPLVESDSAKISAEISKTQPTAINSGPLTSSKLAQDLISSATAPVQAGIPSGAPVAGNGTTGTLPGFAELAPGFRTSGPNLSNLPEPVLLRLPSDVLFDFDSARLKPEADPLLTKAIGLITKYPQADIQIDGYSDSFGKADYNLTLSQQRAEAVQAWLRNHIAQDGYKFHSQGHGSSNFAVSVQGSIEQQQPNRRVEILIQALKL
jgi:outer membrane protein OmpA-like peptidoglycan-associated protein